MEWIAEETLHVPLRLKIPKFVDSILCYGTIKDKHTHVVCVYVGLWIHVYHGGAKIEQCWETQMEEEKKKKKKRTKRKVKTK